MSVGQFFSEGTFTINDGTYDVFPDGRFRIGIFMTAVGTNVLSVDGDYITFHFRCRRVGGLNV